MDFQRLQKRQSVFGVLSDDLKGITNNFEFIPSKDEVDLLANLWKKEY